MSFSNRSAGFKILTVLAAAIIVSLLLIGIFDSGRQYGEAIANKTGNSRTYSQQAEQKIRDTCLGRDGTTQTECIRRIIESTNESQRAEDDLVAQTEMALWAFWMLIVTSLMAAITAIGIYYIWRTLLATQEMVNDTKKMAKDTREIGEDQVRAYVGVKSVSVTCKSNVVGGGPLAAEARVIVANTGTTPAKIRFSGIRVKIHDMRAGPKLIGPPIEHPQTYHRIIGPNSEFVVPIPVRSALASISNKTIRFTIEFNIRYVDIYGAERTEGSTWIHQAMTVIEIGKACILHLYPSRQTDTPPPAINEASWQKRSE